MSNAINVGQLDILANNKEVMPSDIERRYNRQLGRFATTKKKEADRLLIRGKLPRLETINGKAEKATIGANKFKLASIARKDTDIQSDPFVVEVEDSSLSEPMAPHAFGGFLDDLDLQKDEIIALMLDNKGTQEGATLTYDSTAFTEKVLTLLKSQKNKEGSQAGVPELLIAEDIYMDLLSKKITGTATNLWQDFLSTVGGLITNYRISNLIGGRVYALDGRNVVELLGFDPFIDRTKEEDPDSAITNTNYRFIFSTNDFAVELADALLYLEFSGVPVALANDRFKALKSSYILPEDKAEAIKVLKNEIKTIKELGDKATEEQKRSLVELLAKLGKLEK